jgi:hypothetical protein
VKRRKRLLLLGLFLALVVAGIFAALQFREEEQEIRKGAVDQPHLYFQQSKATTASELVVDLFVDTAGQESNGMDAIIAFNPEVLEVAQISPAVDISENKTFFSGDTFESKVKDGRLYIYSLADSPLSTLSGQFKVAQVEFNLKKEQQTSLSFVCNLGNLTSGSSAIWQGKESVNIIDCTSLEPFTYTPSGQPTEGLSPTATGAEATLTPSPTGEPTTSPTEVPSDECEVNSDCQLSLCDCQCYLAGETPEEQNGDLCGINCAGEYGVQGCQCSNGECQEIKTSPTPEPDKATINFKVSLQGVKDSSAVVLNPVAQVIIKDGFSTVAEFSDVELIPSADNKFQGQVSLAEWGGTYTIYIKGEKHLSRKFCYDGQADRCSEPGSIKLTQGINNFDFSGRPLQPGDIVQGGDQSDLVNDRDFQFLQNELNGDETSTADLDYNGLVHGKDIVFFLQTLQTKYGDNI